MLGRHFSSFVSYFLPLILWGLGDLGGFFVFVFLFSTPGLILVPRGHHTSTRHRAFSHAVPVHGVTNLPHSPPTYWLLNSNAFFRPYLKNLCLEYISLIPRVHEILCLYIIRLFLSFRKFIKISYYIFVL